MDDKRWERWVGRSDADRLHWAIGYMTDKAHLQPLRWGHVPEENIFELRARFLEWITRQALQLGGVEWVSRIDGAWRQTQHRRRIAKRNKKASSYFISKKTKTLLAKLARENGKTVHETLETVIQQAAAEKGISAGGEDQFSTTPEQLSSRLKDAAPRPHPHQVFIPSLPPAGGRYVGPLQQAEQTELEPAQVELPTQPLKEEGRQKLVVTRRSYRNLKIDRK